MPESNLGKNKSLQSTEIVSKVENWLKGSYDRRQTVEWAWYLNESYYAGKQYRQWNNGIRKLVEIANPSERLRLTINIFRLTINLIRDNLVRYEPKWLVIPRIATDERAVEDAKKLSKLLDFCYDDLDMYESFYNLAYDGLVKSAGYIETGWDVNARNGQGWPIVRDLDPFDCFVDSVYRLQDSKFFIKAIPKYIDDIKANPVYDQSVTKFLRADNRKAYSTAKYMLESELNQGDSKEAETVILKECWYRNWVKDKITKTLAGGDKSEETYYRPTMSVASTCDDLLLRFDEDTKLPWYPISVFNCSMSPRKMADEGWVSDLRDPQKMVNKLESQILQYNDLMVRGRWIGPKGHGASTPSNTDGEIIEHNIGFPLTQMDIKPLPRAIFEQISNSRRYLEDIGGAHESTLGQIPSGARSGALIDSLKESDFDRQRGTRTRFEKCIANVGEQLLWFLSKYSVGTQEVTGMQTDGSPFTMQIQGASTSAPVKSPDVTPIYDNQKVKVIIESWLSYTQEGIFEKLTQLYKLNAIDRQTLLEGVRFGNVSEIVERMQEQEMKKDSLASLPEPTNSTEAAEAENMKMMLGQMRPPYPKPDPEHIGLHLEYMQSMEYKMLKKEIRKMFEIHVDEEAKKIGLTKEMMQSIRQGKQPEMPEVPNLPVQPNEMMGGMGNAIQVKGAVQKIPKPSGTGKAIA